MEQNCEAGYANYVHLIEKFYFKDSLETSNAYFLVGCYYFERGTLNKSAACFMKSLAVRQYKLGETHKACADCLLNLGIIYKKLGFPLRAH